VSSVDGDSEGGLMSVLIVSNITIAKTKQINRDKRIPIVFFSCSSTVEAENT
jgi:hypothetical protein